MHQEKQCSLLLATYKHMQQAKRLKHELLIPSTTLRYVLEFFKCRVQHCVKMLLHTNLPPDSPKHKLRSEIPGHPQKLGQHPFIKKTIFLLFLSTPCHKLLQCRAVIESSKLLACCKLRIIRSRMSITLNCAAFYF